ncbi:MAG: hypothetical protein J6F30_08835 [Cellulosilyticum sp.]|nr:hypothetical protein [Cellulosilyticum sp.]
MKKLNETMITEVLQILDVNDDDRIEINVYSCKEYANCQEKLLIASFISLNRIGAWLLTQKIKGYEVKRLTDNITSINFYCKDI